MYDERAPAHAASTGYGVERFVSDREHLSDVVRFDQPRLGDDAASLEAGLVVTPLVEHHSVPREALPQQMVQGELGEWRPAGRPERLAASYTLQARRP